MMIAPIIYYILAHIPLNIPSSNFKEIDRLMLEFFGGNSQYCPSIKKLHAPIEKGGFGLMNFRAFNTKYISRWLTSAQTQVHLDGLQLEVEAYGSFPTEQII